MACTASLSFAGIDTIVKLNNVESKEPSNAKEACIQQSRIMTEICAGDNKDHHEVLSKIECEGDAEAIMNTETFCIEKSPFVTTWWTLDAE